MRTNGVHVLCACTACADDVERAFLFTQLWVAKEAVVKARGSGIKAAPGFKGFSVGELNASQA